MEKDAVRRGIGAAHAAGWKACRSDDCGRTALVEKRAADRGALRARFLRDIIVNKKGIWIWGTERRQIPVRWQCDRWLSKAWTFRWPKLKRADVRRDAWRRNAGPIAHLRTRPGSFNILPSLGNQVYTGALDFLPIDNRIVL